MKINSETHYLWRAVDHKGEVLEVFVSKRRNRKATLQFLRKAMKRYGNLKVIVTDKLRSFQAAMKEIGSETRQETVRAWWSSFGTIIADQGYALATSQSGRVTYRNRLHAIFD